MYLIGVGSSEATAFGALSGGFYLFNDQPGENWKSSAAQSFAVTGRYFTPLPYGTTTIARPVSSDNYAGRRYFCGGYTYNLMIDEHHRVWKQGIRGPEVAPSVTPSGSGNIAYLNWYDELTNENSPLSQ